MAEEFRIIVVDEGGTAPRAPAAPDTTPAAPKAVPTAPVTPVVAAPKAPTAPTAVAAVDSAISGGVPGVLAAATTAAKTALGPFAIAVTGTTAALGIAALAVRSFGRMIEKNVNDLSEFSGAIASAVSASGEAESAALRRRAQAIGPELARAERLRSRFETASMDIWTQILDALLQIVKLIEPMLISIITAIESVADNFQAAVAGAAAALGFNHPILKGILDIMLAWLPAGDDDADDDEFMANAFRGVQAAPLPYELDANGNAVTRRTGTGRLGGRRFPQR